MSLPIDGAADAELSVKGLTPGDLVAEPDTEEMQVDNNMQSGSGSGEVEIDGEHDENENVYFCNLPGRYSSWTTK